MNARSRKALPALLLCLLCVPLVLTACGKDQAAHEAVYSANQYFDRGYGAYAFVTKQESGFKAEVYLQFASASVSDVDVQSYRVYLNGGQVAELARGTSAQGLPLPDYFTADVSLPGSVTSLSLVPVSSGGAENAAEAIDMMPNLPEGSLVGTKAVVNNPNPEDRLNLRLAPSQSADSLRHYYNGVDVTVLNAYEGGWVAVVIGSMDGMARGYMKADFLAFGEDAAKVTSAIPTKVSEVDSWALYSLTEESSAAIAEYTAGQTFEILGESAAWWHIRVGGQTGFVRAGAIMSPDKAEPDETPTPGATLETLPGEGRMIIWGADGTGGE